MLTLPSGEVSLVCFTSNGATLFTYIDQTTKDGESQKNW